MVNDGVSLVLAEVLDSQYRFFTRNHGHETGQKQKHVDMFVQHHVS